MININGHFITTDDEYREYFDLEAICAQAQQLCRDREIFVSRAETDLLAVLAAALAGAQARLGNDEDGSLCVACGDRVALIAYALPADKMPDTDISTNYLTGLIVSELGRRRYDAPVTDANTTVPVEPLTRLAAGQTAVLECFDPARDDLSAPLVNGVYLNAGSAKAAVSVSGGNYAEQLILNPGEAVALLTKAGRYVSPHARRIESTVLLLRRLPLGGGRTEVQCMRRGTATPCCRHSFDVATLIDACPDENNGFVALTGGRIVIYSSVIQPDDVDDLEVPTHEKPVKILVKARLLVVLTDAGKVYTNIKSQLKGLGDIIDIYFDEKGDIAALTAQAYSPQPLNPSCDD